VEVAGELGHKACKPTLIGSSIGISAQPQRYQISPSLLTYPVKRSPLRSELSHKVTNIEKQRDKRKG